MKKKEPILYLFMGNKGWVTYRMVPNWKIILFTIFGLSLFADIIGEGLMIIGVLLGWLVGIITKVQWDTETLTKNIKGKASKDIHEPGKKRER